MNRKIKLVLITAFWLIIWQLASLAVGSGLLLPGPADTIRGLLRLIEENGFVFLQDILSTVARCVAAIILALVSGLLLALASYKWHTVRDILSLPAAFFKAVPVMAVAIYLLLLLTSGSVPVFVCWIMCLPIAYTNLLTGFDSMNADTLEMAEIFDIRGYRRLKHIYIPSLFPFFKSAMSLIAGMSWKAVVTAEVLSVPKFSLGYELMNSKYYLNTDELFAYVAVIILVSVLFEKLTAGILSLLEPHEYEGSKIRPLRNAAGSSGRISDRRGQNADRQTFAPRVLMQDIDKSYGDEKILDNLNLCIDAGKVTALMGASGRGKTTIGRIASGLEQSDSGTVCFEGCGRKIGVRADVSNTDATSGGEGRISYVFQEDRLLPWLNVYDNLAVVLPEGCEAREKIEAVLAAVGLENEKSKLPTQLSGGMNHRLAMARAFLYDADFIIADEPFRGLDDTLRRSVKDRLWKPGVVGKTVLLITHSEKDARELADVIIDI